MLVLILNLFCFFIFVRAGELSAAELDNLMTIVANPRQFKIPDWFLNRKKDYKDGKYSQVVSNALDMKLRDDLERLKKIRSTTLSLFFFYFISLYILRIYMEWNCMFRDTPSFTTCWIVIGGRQSLII